MTRSLAVKLMFDKHPVIFKDEESRQIHMISPQDPPSNDMIIEGINADGFMDLYDKGCDRFIYHVPADHLSPKL